MKNQLVDAITEIVKAGTSEGAKLGWQKRKRGVHSYEVTANGQKTVVRTSTPPMQTGHLNKDVLKHIKKTGESVVVEPSGGSMHWTLQQGRPSHIVRTTTEPYQTLVEGEDPKILHKLVKEHGLKLHMPSTAADPIWAKKAMDGLNSKTPGTGHAMEALDWAGQNLFRNNVPLGSAIADEGYKDLLHEINAVRTKMQFAGLNEGMLKPEAAAEVRDLIKRAMNYKIKKSGVIDLASMPAEMFLHIKSRYDDYVPNLTQMLTQWRVALNNRDFDWDGLVRDNTGFIAATFGLPESVAAEAANETVQYMNYFSTLPVSESLINQVFSHLKLIIDNRQHMNKPGAEVTGGDIRL